MIPTVTTDTNSIRHLLRAATAGHHAEVDARFAPLVANGEASYAEFLRASASAIYPLEGALRAAGVVRILPDWSDRARSEALRADLVALDVAEPMPADAPAISSEAYLFGVLYVLEGSRLGARMLARQILSSANARMRRATRYLQHGEGKPLWPTFLQRLESSAAVKRIPEQAVAGACAAFARFGTGATVKRQREMRDAG